MRTAGHVIEADPQAIEDHEEWASLHDELNSLPQSFREPLVLCYLDGMTQEQAAAQMRCPLGTIQSRLARGREKLKTRLEKRGVGLSAVFAGAKQGAFQSCPAPPAWTEATVKLAMQFTQAKGPAIAGAASVALAEEVVRTIVLSKVKVVAAMILVSAILVTGAAAWVTHDRNDIAPPVVARAPRFRPH